MARRRDDESPGIDALFEFLTRAPVWVGPAVAAAAFVVLRWVLPAAASALLGGSSDGRAFLTPTLLLLTKAAPFIAGGVLLVWLAALIKRTTDARRLESQTGPESIAQLTWRQFESLLAEAFRREGFIVREGALRAAPGGADGGVDLRLEKAGAVTLVQCKHWKPRPGGGGRVGVKVVRELLGVVSSRGGEGGGEEGGAQSGIVVASGGFTREAVAFAAQNPIRLIDGAELQRMIAAVQRSGRMKQPTTAPPAPPAAPPQKTQPAQAQPAPAAALPCPTCGATMVRRTARTGAHAGKDFLGCSTYPACRGKRQLG